MTTGSFSEERRDAFVERIINAALGMFDIYSIHIGDRLGFYQLLASAALTTHELAARGGCHERYAREWLEQQAVTGMLDVDDTGDVATRRFSLPPEHAEALIERDSLNYVASIVQLIVGAASPLSAILKAYRVGGGVPYADYGVDVREGQAAVNRAAFLQSLPGEWLPAIPDVHERLLAEPAARVADLGCGAGWSSIGIATGYPLVRIDGFDLDPASIDLANENLRGFGVEDRVTFHLRDAGDAKLAGMYDLVTIMEALHDMSAPVSALRTARRLVASGGCVLVADERVADTFTAPGDDIERLMYGWSFLHCLPAGMADEPSVGTGTVLRPVTVRQYALDAGFSDVEVLPIDNLFFRFYRLYA